MKLTLSKETLRRLAVKSAVRAGLGIVDGSVRFNCVTGGFIGPNVSQTAPICDVPPDWHKAANPAQDVGALRPQLP